VKFCGAVLYPKYRIKAWLKDRLNKIEQDGLYKNCGFKSMAAYEKALNHW